MSEVILEATGLVKSFLKQNETIEIVKGVDFTLQQKEMVAITGASGVGKSTFLHLLGTLEKPDAGTILYGPQKQNILNLTSHGIAQFRNRALGFIFQFHHLLPEFSALENVMLPALISGLSKEEARVKAQDLLSFVGSTKRALSSVQSEKKTFPP
jgi:lipoprotein-releasing system ATP-binding protein